jgi:glycosyltransferase involved in cell wall biosynthesis
LTDKKNVIKHRCIKNSLGGSLIAYFEALTWSQKKLEKYTTSFIAPSVFLKNKMIEAGFSANKMVQIYNFTEAEKFEPQATKEKYYVYLGRLSSEKGIKTLLKVAEINTEIKLKIIGDGPLRESLEKRYKKNHIEFCGYQKWDTIKQILGQAQFMVLPSECYENNPLSIIESFALGTPVLGSNIGGIPELITPEVNGMLFKPADTADLNHKIIEMINSRDWDFKNISEKAQGIFNPDRFYHEIMDCYSLKN